MRIQTATFFYNTCRVTIYGIMYRELIKFHVKLLRYTIHRWYKHFISTTSICVHRACEYSTQKNITNLDETPRKYIFHVYGFHNGLRTFCLQMTDHSSCEKIFSVIEMLTKISTKLQILSYKNTIISPNHLACTYGFADENNIHLSVKGHGGGPSDDG